MELVIVKVTENDIEIGAKRSCFDCAINIAITRAMKISYRSCSIARTIRIHGCLNDIIIPKWMEKWIIDWDNNKKVYPFEFSILKKMSVLDWEIIKN